ncbi:MAG: NERD domain-containing protein [Chloroflexi bacterium]|nr:NERD domain-containing protein [Chloroflexota bacterium]
MTTRVFEFENQLATSVLSARNRPPTRAAGLKACGFASLVIVPVAGAAEAPVGWLLAGLAAIGVMSLAAIFGPRLKWGWLVLVSGGLGLALPRGTWGNVGPPLFVATLLFAILWLVHRRQRRAIAARLQSSSPERAAQLMLGFSGERQVGRVLASELPQAYALINGLKLPHGAGDIDHLVVGPTGVFLLETKTMAGRVVCAPDGTWHRTRIGRGGTAYPAYIGDPAAQVQRNIFAVRQTLRKRLPDLVRGTPLWIEGLVVFPHPKTELETDNSRVPAVLLSDATLRICTHSPRRRLQSDEVDAVVRALIAEARTWHSPPARQSAQALVELALLLPVVLTLVFGTIGVSRYVQTRAAVVAVAHESARAGALASSPANAIERIQQRTVLVAPGLGLDVNKLVVGWDLSRFGSTPGQVATTVEYPVDFSDLPMVGSLLKTEVRAEHVEWVDPFRSGMSMPPGSGD